MTNWLQVLGHSRGVIHALGWTLIHFCWQGLIVASCLWSVLRLLKRRTGRAQPRYIAACVAMLLLVAIPVLTFVHLMLDGRTVTPMELAMPVFSSVGGGAGGVSMSWTERLASLLDRSLPLVLVVWASGVAFFVGRLGVGTMAARRMKWRATKPVAAELQVAFRNLCSRLGVSRTVVLLHSALVQVPTVIGWMRPVILIPMSALSGLSMEQLEALLAHELAHIRRHDYFVLMVQSVVETLLFYHPAVWWVSKQVRLERESCCDEVAVGVSGDELGYARALSFLENYRASQTEMALSAHGGELTMRIKRVLGYEEKPAGLTMAAAVVLLMAVASGAWMATAARAQPKNNDFVAAATLAVPGASQPIVAAAVKARAIKPMVKSAVAQGGKTAPAVNQVTDPRYQRWLDEDVVWIIAGQERAAFEKLSSDEERDHFIEQFWARRDAATQGGNFRDQHYQRIAYANEHFAGTVAGWKTDRGHTWIVYGKPDVVESHPEKTDSQPFEVWHYNSIPGIGENIDFRFADACRCGDYRYETLPGR